MPGCDLPGAARELGGCPVKRFGAVSGVREMLDPSLSEHSTAQQKEIHGVHQNILEPFGGSFLAWCPPAPWRAALLWSAR